MTPSTIKRLRSGIEVTKNIEFITDNSVYSGIDSDMLVQLFQHFCQYLSKLNTNKGIHEGFSIGLHYNIGRHTTLFGRHVQSQMKLLAKGMHLLAPDSKYWSGDDLKLQIWACFVAALEGSLSEEMKENTSAPDYKKSGLKVYDYDLSALNFDKGDYTWCYQWYSAVDEDFRELIVPARGIKDVVLRLADLISDPAFTFDSLDEAQLLVRSLEPFCQTICYLV